MNDLDLCLEVVSTSSEPLRYIRRWLSRKPLQIRVGSKGPPIGNDIWGIDAVKVYTVYIYIQYIRSAIIATAWLLVCIVCRCIYRTVTCCLLPNVYCCHCGRRMSADALSSTPSPDFPSIIHSRPARVLPMNSLHHFHTHWIELEDFSFMRTLPVVSLCGGLVY